MQEVLIHGNLLKRFDSDKSKSDVDKLDTDKKKNIPSNLSNLKSILDKLDIGKLETTSVDLGKLSNLVNNDVAKKNEYDELVKKLLILVI